MLAFVLSLSCVLLYGLLAVYVERKTAAFVQHRLGPYEVGKYGLLQSLADILKALQKEDIQPLQADKVLFRLAPLICFLAALVPFAFLPLFPHIPVAVLPTGLFFILAILSFDTLGILLAGWSANSKFSVYGAFRAVAQMISYEVPLGFCIVCVVLVTGSLHMPHIALAQGPQASGSIPLLGFITAVDVSAWGGIFTWNIVKAPILVPVFVCFFIASLAQAHRAPFDLPESESELVAGYHTEYSGFRWALFMLSEYGIMLVLSLVGVWCFFGAGHSPLPNIGTWQLATWTSSPQHGGAWSLFWLFGKAGLLIWVQMWIRWTFPRLRPDQLMLFSWKYMTPLTILFIYLTGIWILVVGA